MSFEHLGLRKELLKAIATKGYSTPTPIQAGAIPVILSGRDILARAQTGTGKTDAFALPMVEILSREADPEGHVRSLVLAPTRELALQVSESIKDYARRVSLRCTVVYGGVNIIPQINRLNRGIDILVATPGRLLDLAGQKYLDLSRVEFLVFDEADRMLDLGFSREINEIIDLVPVERRTMLFSATYTPQIRALAAKMLKNPELIEVTPTVTAAESVAQKVYRVATENKRGFLLHLMKQGDWSRVLVFTRTKHGANKLTEKLAAQGISVAALHSNKSQSFRIRTLEAFKNNEIGVLVATDVAARGLDITHLPVVVNFDVPGIPEDYVHRIGRTGRAGIGGLAITLVAPEETRFLKAIENLLGKPIPVETASGYADASVVPSFVLLRPGNERSEKKADRGIKAMASGKPSSKKEPSSRKGGPGKGGKAPLKAGKTPSKAGSKRESDLNAAPKRRGDSKAGAGRESDSNAAPKRRGDSKSGPRQERDSDAAPKRRGDSKSGPKRRGDSKAGAGRESDLNAAPKRRGDSKSSPRQERDPNAAPKRRGDSKANSRREETKGGRKPSRPGVQKPSARGGKPGKARRG